jgi:hypothetical protein
MTIDEMLRECDRLEEKGESLDQVALVRHQLSGNPDFVQIRALSKKMGIKAYRAVSYEIEKGKYEQVRLESPIGPYYTEIYIPYLALDHVAELWDENLIQKCYVTMIPAGVSFKLKPCRFVGLHFADNSSALWTIERLNLNCDVLELRNSGLSSLKLEGVHDVCIC